MVRPLVIFLVVVLFVGTAPGVRAQTQAPLLELRLDGLAFDAVWNADETQILVFGDDEAARIYDVQSGQEIMTLPHIIDPRPEFNWVVHAVWSPDETRIATSGTDEQIKVWNAATGERLYTWFFPSDEEEEIPIIYLYWSKDGTRVYAFRNKHTDIKVWDAITGEALFSMAHPGPVYRVEWNADQSRIMTMGLPMSKEELVAELEEQHPDTLDLDETAQLLNVMSLQTTVFIWDSETGELLRELNHPEPQVHDIRWSQDGTRVLTTAGIDLAGPFAALLIEGFAAGMEDSSMEPEFDLSRFEGRSAVRIWNLVTGEIEFEIVQDNTIDEMAWSPDETQVITASFQGPLTIWDVASGGSITEMSYPGSLLEAQWGPTGRFIWGWTQEPVDCAFADCTYGWLIWNAINGELVLERYSREPYGKSAYWNPDQTLAALEIVESEYFNDCTGDACRHEICIQDMLGNERLRLPHSDTILQITWNKAGTRLLTTEAHGVIRIWEIPQIFL